MSLRLLTYIVRGARWTQALFSHGAHFFRLHGAHKSAKHFAMTLAQWMAANGYRDERLAEMVGVSRSHLTHIRLGRRPPSLKVAAKLVRITGLPVETFCRLEAA